MGSFDFGVPIQIFVDLGSLNFKGHGDEEPNIIEVNDYQLYELLPEG